MFPADVVGVRVWTWRRAGVESLEYLVGIVLGVIAVAVLVRSSWAIAPMFEQLRESVGIPQLYNWIWPEHHETDIEASARSVVWALLFINGLLAIYPFFARTMSPSFAVGMLFCLIALGYLLLTTPPRPIWTSSSLCRPLHRLVEQGGLRKYRFPGMATANCGSYYDKDRLDRPGTNPGDPPVPLLQDKAVLDAWWPPGEESPGSSSSRPPGAAIARASGRPRCSTSWSGSTARRNSKGSPIGSGS